MGTVITNLKARFGVDTSDFKKGLKDGEKATDDFKGAAGGIIDEFASMFGVNMGSVNNAMGTANKSLNFLGQSFKGAAVSSNVFSIALKILKFALVATGIGAIVVVLGSLIAYFTKSGEGADKFAKIMAQLKSIFDNVIERMVQFGEGMADVFSGRFQEGWQKMRTVFKGLGDEIKEDWKAVGKLADAEDALEDREIDLITSLSNRKAKVSELRQLAKEEQDDQNKKLSMLKDAEALTRSVYTDQISLERERLRIMKEKLAISAKDPTDEQRREIAIQEGYINDLYREQADLLKGITREKNSVLKAIEKEIDLVTKLALEEKLAWEASIKRLKMPDFNQSLAPAFKALRQAQITVKEISKEMSEAVEAALESTAVGIGEFLGQLLIGDAGMKNFAAVMAGAFADLAITIGKIAISAAITVGALDKILKNPANWPIALAAGIALVAVGTAIRGSLSKAASGGSGGGSASSGSLTYDTRSAIPALQTSKVQITGKLVAEGKDLVYVFDQENTRKGTTT